MRSHYLLPDILPGVLACDSGVHLYAHSARPQDARSMIAFSSNALSVILSGRKRLQHGLASHEFELGRALLFKPGHCLSTDIDEEGSAYRSMLVFFTDAQLRDFLARHKVIPQPSELAQRSFVDFQAAPALVQLAESWWQAPDLRQLSAPRKCAKLDDVLLLILETLGADVFGFFTAAKACAPAERLRQVMEAHWRDDLSLDELAFLCHMSRSTFKRHFQVAYGVGPGQWIQQRRLQLAAHLLMVERRRASDIYLDVGFSTVSAFTQSFKSYFGMTPKIYQNKDG